MVRSSIHILRELWGFVGHRIEHFGNFSAYLEYLLQRYGLQFQNHTRNRNDRILTRYQPHDADFSNRTIRVKIELWLLLKVIKKQTGYSMSYLIRVMIEWDMQEQNINRESLLELDHSIGVIEDSSIVMHTYNLEIQIDFLENQYSWDSKIEYIHILE